MFKNIFIKLCNEKGESPSFVCRQVGIAPATFSGWTDTTIPRKATLYRIADYFGVSVDYLLGNTIDVNEKTPDEKTNAVLLDGQNIFMIPIFENASAGFGAMAIDMVVDYLPLYFTSAQEAEETICIKVRGDSMYPKIEDGDLIQVHKQSTVDSGQVGVVLIDGEEAFVKKVVYGETWIELHSFNPMYKTMRFNGADTLRIQILGVVKKVIKEM